MCLPKTPTLRDQENHRLLVVTGWGADIHDQVGQQLQDTRVQVFEELYCNLTHLGEYRSREAVPNGFSSDLFCAGDAGGSQGVCRGDSGSPAVFFQPLQKNYVLKGIVSGGLTCGTQDHPNIYVRVTDEKILNWVHLQISEIESSIQTTSTRTTIAATTSKSAIPETDKSCPGLDTCKTRTTCPYIRNKYLEAHQAPSKKKEIISSLKSLVCNKQRKAFCCPAPGSYTTTRITTQTTTTTATATTTTTTKGSTHDCRTIVTRQPNRRSDAPCVFPFIFKNVTYDGCTNVEDTRGRFWCSTKVDDNYRHVQGEGEFGYCEGDCAKDPKGMGLSGTPPQSTTKTSALRPLSFIEDGTYLPRPGTEDGTYLPRPDNCGINPIKHKARKRRAVGGHTTKIGDFPFSALLGYTVIEREYNQLKGVYENKKSIKFKCGGTLINHWYVLTAAQCQGTKRSKRIAQVVLGEWEVGKNPDCQRGGECFPETQTFDIAEGDVIVHEDYEKKVTNVINDIALVRLNKPAVMNEGVRMACLTFDREEATRKLGVSDLLSGLSGHNATLIGWGLLGYDPDGGANQGDYSTFGVGSKFQQQLNLPLLTTSQCYQKYEGFEVEEGQVCAGGELGKDSCNRDAGGGLLLSDRRADEFSMPWYLIGVVSFGSKHCGNGKPGVYTLVSHYNQWIKKNLRPISVTKL